MTPDEKPPSREELAEDVAARLRASGLDAASDGENVTVVETPRLAAADGASTGKNIARVIGVTLGSLVITLLLSLLWFGLVFSVLGGATDAGQRAAQVGVVVAALIAGAGAILIGAEAKTISGKRDVAALIVGLVLGVPLLLIMIAKLGGAMDALTRGYGKLGIVALILFFGGFAYVGDRVFKKR